MSAITILLVAIVALLAGMEGILDEFQFHQPLVACTLIGLVTGHLQEGILLGGSLQMMALGWATSAPPSRLTPLWPRSLLRSSWCSPSTVAPPIRPRPLPPPSPSPSRCRSLVCS